jgi:hypothetical protein
MPNKKNDFSPTDRDVRYFNNIIQTKSDKLRKLSRAGSSINSYVEVSVSETLPISIIKE